MSIKSKLKLREIKTRGSIVHIAIGLMLVVSGLFPFSVQKIYATDSYPSTFLILETWPAQGQTNVPTDLRSNLAGSTYNGMVGGIVVGYGPSDVKTQKGAGLPCEQQGDYCPCFRRGEYCVNPPRPDIKKDSLNNITLFISSSADPNLNIGYSSSNSSPNFQFYPTNPTFPGGVKLKPHTEYTITLKGGSGGIIAVYSDIYGSNDAYLANDYSWSFTTGDGPEPERIKKPTPTTPKPQLTPSNTPTAVISHEPTPQSISRINPTQKPIPTVKKQSTNISPIPTSREIGDPVTTPEELYTITPSPIEENRQDIKTEKETGFIFKARSFLYKVFQSVSPSSVFRFINKLFARN